MIISGATVFLQSTSWSDTFSSLGLMGARTNISESLSSRYPGVLSPSGPRMPRVSELEYILPKRLNVMRLYGAFMAGQRRRHLTLR